MGKIDELRERVFHANMEIPRQQLAKLTWGNVSGCDRETELVAIKPSGVSYDKLTVDDIVVVDFQNRTVHGTMKPSSDTRTHTVLYRAFPEIGGIVHTHSTYAVAWAQALKAIPIFGTTHADQTVEDIPCTPPMETERIENNYEEETGNQIVAHFESLGLDYREVPMVLVGCHGPFTWGSTVEKAVENAIALEEIAKMAAITAAVAPKPSRLPDSLRQKHFQRKHGPNAYYGQ